jgi:Leucine-rich repeat (LRR) protein
MKRYFNIALVIVFAVLLSACSLTGSTKPVLDSKQNSNEVDTNKQNGNVVNEVVVSNSDTIDLSNKGLDTFPKDILAKTKIRKLILSNNNIKTLPSQIGELVNLEELYLDNNILEGSLPGEIRKMTKLRILDAHSNNMSGVPAEVGQLQKLQILNLADNQLTGLPNEMSNLKNLKTFNISGNNYSTLDLGIIQEKLPASVNIIK